MDLHQTYPAISDLYRVAKTRVPGFVWEYLDSGTGRDATKARNRKALDRLGFVPNILHGEVKPDLSVAFLGQKYPLPFGVAPIGMGGLVWPGAEHILAEAAAAAQVPYTLSTVACQSPEDMSKTIGEHAWFQLYPPRDPDIRKDMLRRTKNAGFRVLVLTVDVPVASRRERLLRSGLTQPPRVTPRLLTQALSRPAWCWGIARQGIPRMRTLDKYLPVRSQFMPPNAHVGYLLRTAPDWEYLKWLRDHWEGMLVVKGVLHAADAPRLEAAGVDALWLSNHAGRQFDAAPAAINALPSVRAGTGLPIVFDGGVESGLDIMRAFALGADFVMMGRAALCAVAAIGKNGANHLFELLAEDLYANLGQLAATNLQSLPPVIRLDESALQADLALQAGAVPDANVPGE